VTARYAPATLDKLATYERDLEARVLSGAITKDEATTLLETRRKAMFRALDEPKRAVNALCPDCGGTTTTIGTVQTFRCPCSPLQERSVWDARQT
jgi:tRNA(Ile2) C34 agmatinyltransferase TiaS